MLNYHNCSIARLSAHKIGNRANGDELQLSKQELIVNEEQMHEPLLKYFISHFNVPEFFNLTFSNGDISLNPVYRFASKIFETPESFHEQTVHLAGYLYECSNHPNIKSGELYVCLMHNLELEGEVVNALGIFKAESKDAILKLNAENGNYTLNIDSGTNVDKLDKGCLIFNTDAEKGYKICSIDRTNKSADSQYWKDTFLNLKPCADNFHQTRQYMDMAQTYVKQRLSDDFEMDKAEKIGYLNRSMGYFKNNEQFVEEDFTQEVFGYDEVIESFKKYKSDYQQDKQMELNDGFEVSSPAVKKQGKIFKSILKLDKNFHIYIHGDKKLIEKGVDTDGQKFYKIYYQEES